MELIDRVVIHESSSFFLVSLLDCCLIRLISCANVLALREAQFSMSIRKGVFDVSERASRKIERGGDIEDWKSEIGKLTNWIE